MNKKMIINKVEYCRNLINQYKNNPDNTSRLKGIENITNKIEWNIEDIDLLNDNNDKESYIELMIKICDDNIEYITRFLKKA